MGQIRIPKGDLPRVRAELRRCGASGISRRPAQFDDSVRVLWVEPDDAPINSANLPTRVLPWLATPVLIAAYAALMVVVFSVVGLAGGIGPP